MSNKIIEKELSHKIVGICFKIPIKRYLENSRIKLRLMVNFRDEYLKPRRVFNSGVRFADSRELVDLHRSDGVASLPVILGLMLLILAVGIGITALAFNESFIAAGQKQSAEAFLYAEAGARDALIRIARNKNYACVSPSTGCYQIDFVTGGCSANEGCARITVSSTTSPKVIISEGRVNSNIRKVEVDVLFDASLNGEIATTTWQELTN